jgi:NADPH:quinone reductase-like Zn-dependent oxidoreductase
VRESGAVALKPANVSHAQAAAVPIAALTALQALRDQAHLKSGQKVLINGASGGVGTYAVQIAKAMGADVTGSAARATWTWSHRWAPIACSTTRAPTSPPGCALRRDRRHRRNRSCAS